VTPLELTPFFIGVPLLVGWCKWRLWEWRKDHGLS
jgi:hypothetical protein